MKVVLKSLFLLFEFWDDEKSNFSVRDDFRRFARKVSSLYLTFVISGFQPRNPGHFTRESWKKIQNVGPKTRSVMVPKIHG